MIQKAASGKEKQAYKYIWLYANEYSDAKLQNKLKLLQSDIK